jgi:hypothetical protein
VIRGAVGTSLLEVVPDPEQPAGDPGTRLHLETELLEGTTGLEDGADGLPERTRFPWTWLDAAERMVQCANGLSVHGRIVARLSGFAIGGSADPPAEKPGDRGHPAKPDGRFPPRGSPFLMPPRMEYLAIVIVR